LYERIYIGNDIVITVVDVRENRVRIGIDAPVEVPVYREEILPTDHPANNHQPHVAG
jgi:carbon storage regulator